MQIGKYIIIEGLEGAGKSTVISALQKMIHNIGYKVYVTREPGGTSLGEQIRSLVKQHQSSGEIVQDATELLLMYAARLQLITEVIEPALKEGKWILSDRSEWSTYAYQGGGRNIPQTTIKQLSNILSTELSRTGFTQRYFNPDLIIFLDIDPSIGFARIKKRGEPIDRIEKESIIFFHKVRSAYRELIKNSIVPVIQIDASKEPAVVIDSIEKELKKYLDKYHERI